MAHEALGAPMVLPPLLATDLPEDVIWLHHFSWHVGTIAVAAIIALFVHAAGRPGSVASAFIATAMSVGFAALGIGLGITGSSAMWGTPAPYVWSLIAIIGGVGLGLEWNAHTSTTQSLN